MKKFAWLLALPYVVTVSTRIVDTNCMATSSITYQCDRSTVAEYSINYGSHTIAAGLDMDRDFAYDWAEALNQAHKHRTMSGWVIQSTAAVKVTTK